MQNQSISHFESYFLIRQFDSIFLEIAYMPIVCQANVNAIIMIRDVSVKVLEFLPKMIILTQSISHLVIPSQ